MSAQDPRGQDVGETIFLSAGFTQVDAHPDASLLVEGMEATAQWPAVRQLRAWEREHLAVRSGDRVLDVGCGLGDVATSLAAVVGPGGSVVGLDASEAMLTVARSRAAGPVSFEVGDALALAFGDGTFDACRSERTLQWIPDPQRAVAEMVRVLRPGGRLSLIDSDWRTLVADLPDMEAVEATLDAMARFRGEAATSSGGRLLNMVRDTGMADIDCTAAAHLWTTWDPDAGPGPSGLFPLRLIVPQLSDAGFLEADLGDRFLAAAEAAARGGRFSMSLTMVAVTGRKP